MGEAKRRRARESLKSIIYSEPWPCANCEQTVSWRVVGDMAHCPRCGYSDYRRAFGFTDSGGQPMSDSTKIVVERGDTDFEFRDDGLYLGETVVAYTDDYQYGTLIGGLEGGHIAWTVESLLASDVGQRNFGGVVREAVERGLIKRRPHSELPPYERTEKQ